jgi:hypothetical protein
MEYSATGACLVGVAVPPIALGRGRAGSGMGRLYDGGVPAERFATCRIS